MSISYYFGNQQERVLHKERVHMSRQLCSRFGGLVPTCVSYFHAFHSSLSWRLHFHQSLENNFDKATYWLEINCICISYLFVAVINTMPKSNLVKKGFILAYGSRGVEYISSEEGMLVSKHITFSSTHMGSREQETWWVYKISKPALSGIFPLSKAPVSKDSIPPLLNGTTS